MKPILRSLFSLFCMTVILNCLVVAQVKAEQRVLIPESELQISDVRDIIALVRFTPIKDLPMTTEYLLKYKETMSGIGLKRKTFTTGEDGLTLGIYHWDSLAQANAFYTQAWHENIKQKTHSYSLELLNVEAVIDFDFVGTISR